MNRKDGKIFYKIIVVLILVCLFSQFISFGAVTYETGFPYPVFEKPAHLHVVDLWAADDGTMALLNSLQGIVNRTRPEIYILQSRWHEDARWLNNLAQYQDFTYQWHSDPLEVFTLYKSRIQGGVVYDPGFSPSINYAKALAGANDWVIIHPDKISYVQSQGITIRRDLRSQSWTGNRGAMYIALYNELWNSVTHNMLGTETDYYSNQPYAGQTFPEIYTDYPIATNTLNVWLNARDNPDEDTVVDNIFNNSPEMMPVNGLGLMDTGNREGYTIGRVSNGGKLGDGGIAESNMTVNAAKLTGDVAPMPLRPVDLRRITAAGLIYVCLNLTDGDQTWSTYSYRFRRWDPNIVDITRKNMPPLNWEMPSQSVQQAPGLHQYYVDTANNDSFSTGIGGAGYAHANKYSAEQLRNYLSVTGKYLQRSGLRFANVMFSYQTNDFPDQSSFSQVLDTYAKNLNAFGCGLADFDSNADADDQYIFSGVERMPFALSYGGYFTPPAQYVLDWLSSKNANPKPQFYYLLMLNDGNANYTDFRNFVTTIENWPNYRLVSLSELYAAINPDFIITQAKRFLRKAYTDITGSGISERNIAQSYYTSAVNDYASATVGNANEKYKSAAANARECLRHIFAAYDVENKYIETTVPMELQAFDSGFENEDYWQDRGALYSAYVSGYGAEANPVATRSTTAPVYKDSYSVLLKGKDTSNSQNSYVSFAITDDTGGAFKPVTVTEGMRLSYWIYHTGSEDVAVDAHLTDGSYMRNYTSVIDQWGVRIHPACRNEELNKWVYVEADLSPIKGKTIDRLELVYNDGSTTFTGDFQARLDNVQLTSIKARQNDRYVAARVSSDRSIYQHLDLGGTSDQDAIGGQAMYRSSDGIYAWWNTGTSIASGEYNVFVRAKGKGSFGLLEVNNTSGANVDRLSVIINSSTYKDYYCGTIKYDKSFNLRLSDWSSGGMYVDYLYLVPVHESHTTLELSGLADSKAVNGQTMVFSGSSATAHFTWNLGKTLSAGKYYLYARARGGQDVENQRGYSTWLNLYQKKSDGTTVKNWTSWLYPTVKLQDKRRDDYTDIYIGSVNYDGTYDLVLTDNTASPDATTYIDRLYLVSEKEQFSQIDVGNTADEMAVGRQSLTRTTDGICIWWVLNKSLKPGSYNVYVRAKTGGTGKSYSFYQVNNDLAANIKVTTNTINSSSYKDFKVGHIDYDGSYNLRLSDWVQTGTTVDYMYLVPVGN